MSQKTAVIYDGKADRGRVGEITKALESRGYSVRYFNEKQSKEMEQYLTEEKPDLFLTSSMMDAGLTGGMAIGTAAKAGISAVLYSWNSRHGAPAEMRETLASLTPPAGFYQYRHYSDIEIPAFMQVVDDTLAKAAVSEKRPSAISPDKVDASRPKNWTRTQWQ